MEEVGSIGRGTKRKYRRINQPRQVVQRRRSDFDLPFKGNSRSMAHLWHLWDKQEVTNRNSAILVAIELSIAAVAIVRLGSVRP